MQVKEFSSSYNIQYSFYEKGNNRLISVQAANNNQGLHRQQINSLYFRSFDDFFNEWYSAIKNTNKFLNQRQVTISNAQNSNETSEVINNLSEVFNIIENVVIDASEASSNLETVHNVQLEGLKSHELYEIESYFLEKCIEIDEMTLEDIKATVNGTSGDTNGNHANFDEQKKYLHKKINELKTEREAIEKQLINNNIKSTIVNSPNTMSKNWNNNRSKLNVLIPKLGMFFGKHAEVLKSLYQSIVSLNKVSSLCESQEKFTVPTLSDVENAGKISSLPIDMNFIANALEELNKSSSNTVTFSALQQIQQQLNEENFKIFSFSGAKCDPKYDYEFKGNRWVYAYVKYLIKQNNNRIKSTIKELCTNGITPTQQLPYETNEDSVVDNFCHKLEPTSVTIAHTEYQNNDNESNPITTPPDNDSATRTSTNTFNDDYGINFSSDDESAAPENSELPTQNNEYTDSSNDDNIPSNEDNNRNIIIDTNISTLNNALAQINNSLTQEISEASTSETQVIDCLKCNLFERSSLLQNIVLLYMLKAFSTRNHSKFSKKTSNITTQSKFSQMVSNAVKHNSAKDSKIDQYVGNLLSQKHVFYKKTQSQMIIQDSNDNHNKIKVTKNQTDSYSVEISNQRDEPISFGISQGSVKKTNSVLFKKIQTKNSNI